LAARETKKTQNFKPTFKTANILGIQKKGKGA